MKALLAEAKEIYDFVKTDRIDSIRSEAVQSGHIQVAPPPVNKCDTRMNLIHDYISWALKMATFLAWIRSADKYRQYYSERKQGDKDKHNAFFERCDNNRWKRFEFLTENITVHFKRIYKILCMTKVPLSAYVLLTQALKNHVNQGLNAEGPGKFDEILGEGALAQLVATIKDRFNMDGSDPSGRKVGLLDKHVLWAFLVDPFNHSWRSTFKMEGEFALHIKDMLEYFVPDNKDGSHVELRKTIRKQFLVSLMFENEQYFSVPRAMLTFLYL